jgi:hypothetical protein
MERWRCCGAGARHWPRPGVAERPAPRWAGESGVAAEPPAAGRRRQVVDLQACRSVRTPAATREAVATRPGSADLCRCATVL